LVGGSWPYSVILGLVSVYVWVVPWYLNDPDCDFAIRRETWWGNALSIFFNVVAGYIFWPVLPLWFAWITFVASIYHRLDRIPFKVAFWAIFDDKEDSIPILARQQGGETA
jgi:hypothetical protein